ncbi:MAG: GerMN domain-containing protein [Firmicutes bacterium]|nr:GerMN domain-containing protein [Bacillota bacterium]
MQVRRVLKFLAAVVLILLLALGGSACRKKQTPAQPPLKEPASASPTEVSSPEKNEPILDPSKEYRPRMVYYVDPSGSQLVPLTVQVEKVEGIARETLKQLVRSEENVSMAAGMGAQPTIPIDTEIRGLSIRNGLARVDFSKELLDYSGFDQERLMVESIVWTLTEFPTVQSVQIMVEGKILSTLPGGTRVDKPLRR